MQIEICLGSHIYVTPLLGQVIQLLVNITLPGLNFSVSFLTSILDLFWKSLLIYLKNRISSRRPHTVYFKYTMCVCAHIQHIVFLGLNPTLGNFSGKTPTEFNKSRPLLFSPVTCPCNIMGTVIILKKSR